VTGATTRVHVTMDLASPWGDDRPHPPMDN
jgi:hypothetical protein